MKMFGRKLTCFLNRRQIQINNIYLYKPKKWFLYSFILIIILLVLISFIVLNDDISEFFINMPNLGKRIKELLSWDFKAWTKKTQDIYGDKPFFNLAFLTIWDTLILALSGTIIGVSLGIPFALLCANNIVNNKYINGICKFILNILRTIPSFVYALFFIEIFDKSTLTITLVVTLFTFSMSSKMLFDKIEHINISPYESLTSIGTNKFKAFNSAIIPQVKPHILSVLFYSLEVNLKYISIIALISKRGFGEMVDYYKEMGRWNKVGFLLFLLIITILTLELIIFLLKKYVFDKKSILLDDKETKKFLNIYRKNLNKKNFNFYIDYVILKQWNINFKILKNKYKNKEITKNNYKLEKNKLLKERKKLIFDFKKFYKIQINKDKTKFNNIKKEYLNQPKKWFFENEYNILTRYDKAYLTKFNHEVNLLKNKLKNEINQTIEKKHKEFIESLTIERVIKYKSFDYIKKIIISILFLSIFIYSLTTLDAKFQNENFHRLGWKIKLMFNIEWKSIFFKTKNVGNTVIYLLFETLLISLIGTLIGFIFAFIFATLSSKNVVNKYIAIFFTIISIIIRPVPTYIYALFFVIIVGPGPVNGMLALAMGTTGMLSKYIRELYNNIDNNLLKTMHATGLNNFQKFRYVTLPYTISEITTWLIYRFEINYKEVIMLSIVGAGSIGFTLKSYFSYHNYREFGALLFGIIIVSLFIEYLSTSFKQKIKYGRNPKIINKIITKIRKRKIIKYKLNAKYLNIDYSNMDYDQLKSLWINTNIDIYKKNKGSKKSYYYSYCKKYNLDLKNCKENSLYFEKNFILKCKKIKKNLKI